MTRRRLITAGAVAIVLGTALPSVASAADYCVAPNANCGANNVDTLQAALDEAAKGDDADRVLLGVGTYVAESLTGFDYNSQTAPVEIVGAGRDRTILTAPPEASGQVLDLYGPQGTSVHDLKIRIPKQTKYTFFGLDARADASRVDVVENPDQKNYRVGVRLTAPALMEDSSVTLGPAGTIGVTLRNALLASSPGVVRGSTLTAGQALNSEGGGRVERSTINGSVFGVYAVSGVTDISNSLVRFTNPAGSGVYADVPTAPGTVNMNGVTVVGPASNGRAVVASTFNNAAQNVTVNVTNSILRAHQSLDANGKGPGVAQINASFSDYDPSADTTQGTGAIHETDVQNAGDARFVNPDAGDFRLLPGSPMVDAGDPATAQGLDLDGNPLVADGNGDGAARRDLGAYELQPPPPPPSPDTSAPVISGFRAARSAVSYRLSESARIVVKVQRRLPGKHARYRTIGKLSANAPGGANRTRVGARLRRKEARPGRYRAVIVAADAAGNRSAARTAVFRVRRR